jgi:hypothetical protein
MASSGLPKLSSSAPPSRRLWTQGWRNFGGQGGAGCMPPPPPPPPPPILDDNLTLSQLKVSRSRNEIVLSLKFSQKMNKRFFSFLSWTVVRIEKQIRLLVRFFGRICGSTILFRDLLTFRRGTFCPPNYYSPAQICRPSAVPVRTKRSPRARRFSGYRQKWATWKLLSSEDHFHRVLCRAHLLLQYFFFSLSPPYYGIPTYQRIIDKV